MSDYPEHAMLTAISSESNAVGEFLDTSGYTLCEWRVAGNNGEPRFVWTDGREHDGPPDTHDYLVGLGADYNPDFEEWDEGFFPVMLSIERILAKHYGIDLDKLEAEKRAMLDAQQELNLARREQSG